MNNSQRPNLSELDQNQQQLHLDQQHPLANYQFSPDELRVLKECNTESFFQRSLPFGTGFGLAAYFGVKHGYFKPNLKYGAVPKVIAGVVIGYFLGKFSYQQKCAEKLMRLPNSKIAEALRQRKKSGIMGSLTPDQNFGTGLSLSPFTPNTPDMYTDEHVRSQNSTVLDLDTDSRPTLSGLDDIYRPSLDNPTPQVQTDLPLEPAKPGVTYDELRKKNREEYLKRQQNPYSKPTPPDTPIVIRPYERQPPQTDDSESKQRGQKNKYGDTWTN